MMTNEELIAQLIDAAYDSGYYSGKKEDGEPHHLAAMKRREKLRKQVLARMNIMHDTLKEVLKDYEVVAGLTGLRPENFELIRGARAVIAEQG